MYIHAYVHTYISVFEEHVLFETVIQCVHMYVDTYTHRGVLCVCMYVMCSVMCITDVVCGIFVCTHVCVCVHSLKQAH